MIYYDHSLAVVGTSFFYLLQKKVIVALAVCFNMTAFRSKGRSHLSTLCIERVNVGGGNPCTLGTMIHTTLSWHYLPQLLFTFSATLSSGLSSSV